MPSRHLIALILTLLYSYPVLSAYLFVINIFPAFFTLFALFSAIWKLKF